MTSTPDLTNPIRRDPDYQTRLEAGVTDQVIASFGHARTDRLRTVMASLVSHLHAFAREIRLTEDEWDLAIRYLTDTGQICTDTRQEFILLSDVLGLSMLTVGINSPAIPGATESTVFGPFFVENSPEFALGESIADGVSGLPCYVSGRVLGASGGPVPGARLEIWEADADGFYDVQYDETKRQARGHLFADDQGAYRFWSVLPAPYPIPADGPVGRLLDAARRSPMRPAHIHFMVTAPGYGRLITHIFVGGGPHLSDDAVFAVKQSLITDFVRHPAGSVGPDGSHRDTDWYQAEFDIVLAPDQRS